MKVNRFKNKENQWIKWKRSVQCWKNYNKDKDSISISITVNNIDDAIEFLEISKK